MQIGERWRRPAEWALRAAMGAVGLAGGWVIAERLGITGLGLAVYWPVWAGLYWWLVIREVRLRPAPPAFTYPGSVVIEFTLSGGPHGSADQRAAIHRLADQIEARLQDTGLGRYDGDEYGAGGGTLYLYGDDPDALLGAIRDLLVPPHAGVSFTQAVLRAKGLGPPVTHPLGPPSA